MMEVLSNVRSRAEFRAWLTEFSSTEKECWIRVKRGVPKDPDTFWYLDAVEEALCFGWIDSTQKVVDGVTYQRFSPRRKNSLWSELNLERVRRLEKLGLMTDAGRKVCPLEERADFKPDPEVVTALENAGVWDVFVTFPPLYQRVRLYNVQFYKSLSRDSYQKALKRLIEETAKGKTYGEWNDHGRLTDF